MLIGLLLALGVPAIVVLALGLARAAASADHASDLAFRALMLRRLARRRGDRRVAQRRTRDQPVATDRRRGERRHGERRLDATAVDMVTDSEYAA